MEQFIMWRALICLILLAGSLTPAGCGARSFVHNKETEPVESDDRLGEMVTIPAGRNGHHFIPAGSFLMGNNGKEGFDNPDELPQHWVELPAYQIGKYEVTRGQYRKFIEAGGYKDPQYWSAEGWKWKESDVIVYAGMYGRVART